MNPTTEAKLAVDDFGVQFPASEVSFDALASAFTEAVQGKSRASWIIGDCYAYAQAHGLEDAFAQVLDGRGISLRTAQNYASVVSAWPKAARLVPLSFSHYEAAAPLARTRLEEALALLQTAYDAEWDRDALREKVAEALGNPNPSAEVLLVYDRARRLFVPSFVPDWLPDGYTRQITVRFQAAAGVSPPAADSRSPGRR